MSARFLAGGALVLAACFDPAVPEGLPCGPPPELACPIGQTCTAEGTCRVPGSGEADAARADGPGEVDSPPGTPDARSPDAMGGFTVSRIDEVSDDIGIDQDPSMTIDGRELVWSSTRAGGVGSSDLWHSTRASTSSLWGTPEPLTILNSIADEQSPEIGRNGLSLYFVTTRGTSHDVWVTFRASTSDPWNPPMAVAGLSTSASEHNLTVQAHLTAVVDRELVVGGPRDLFLSERAGVLDPWPSGVPIAELNTGDSEGAPFLSADHLTLYFHRTAPPAIQQIHVATRTDPDEAFSAPQPILDNHDSDPWASDDGDTLLFNRGGDIYLATR